MIGGIPDGMNMMSKLTWARIQNAGRVMTSYHISRSSKNPNIKGLPISLSFEPTTSCNLRCPECPSGLRSFTRPTGMLDQHLFQKVIDELQSTLLYLTFYFQGEPYLNPSFLDMVGYASSNGIYTATSTNAHFLSEEAAHRTVVSKLDRLIISIDGTTQDSYQAYRIGGSLQKVLDGTRNILAAKKALRANNPHVVFQFLVVGPNEHQMGEVQTLAKELGVEQVVFKTAQIYNYENGSPLIPSDQRYSRYRKNIDGTWSIKNRLFNQCWKMWQGSVITWDGRVVPCCFDKDAHYVVGDLKSSKFTDIWYGEKYNDFRKSLFHSRNEIEMCRNCTEGGRVFA